jgi:hypothetical protein
MLGTVHAILGIRAHPAPAGGRIPTITCGMTGSIAQKNEQSVAAGPVANRPVAGTGTLRPDCCAGQQTPEAC